MSSQKILDTHIHLWPSTAVSPTDHDWMTPGHMLAKRHSISDYTTATSSTPPFQHLGFIYVETDRFLPAPEPSIPDTDATNVWTDALQTWANEPLQELKFLRRIVEDAPEEGDGFSVGDGAKMVGCVIWAPFHLDPKLFNLYMSIAERIAGPLLWQRVVGFRYLLQGKGEDYVNKLVKSEGWLRNILRLRDGRGKKGWSFDIGVDAHRDGVAVVESIADMVDRVRALERESTEKGSVRFAVNHLCKPLLTVPHTSWSSFPRYEAALSRLAIDKNVYMKLSGAFNEFEPGPTPISINEILDCLRPYLEIAEKFGDRVMFGSDWPVCNVGGPLGEESWTNWKLVVGWWVNGEGKGVRTGLKEDNLWWRAGREAYGIEGLGEDNV